MTRPSLSHEQILDAHLQAAGRLIGRSATPGAASRVLHHGLAHWAGDSEAALAAGAVPRWESLGQMVEWAHRLRAGFEAACGAASPGVYGAPQPRKGM